MDPVPLWTDYLNMIMITASVSCHNKVMRRRRHTNILWSIHFDISWHWPLPPPPLGIVHWSGKWPELLQSGWSYWRTVSHRTVLPTFENNFLASTDRQLFFKNVLLLLFEIFSLFFGWRWIFIISLLLFFLQSTRIRFENKLQLMKLSRINLTQILHDIQFANVFVCCHFD